MLKSITFVSLVLLPYLCTGVENPRFKAECTDGSTHGFRAGTDINGMVMEGTWDTEERFNTTWTFEYDGAGLILIDGKPGRTLAQHPGVMIVSERPGTNGTAAGIWTYAIQLGLKSIVASQVNAYGGFGPAMAGVKARSTNLDCSFDVQ